MTLRWLLALAFFALGCGGETHPRCAQCGMLADVAPRWEARVGEARFDAPKCLFRWATAGSRPLTDAFVKDYYGQETIPALEAVYVSGSDVLSPMGDDLVPLRTEAEAERFAADHGGEVHRSSAIDAQLLSRLR
ncbi:MAG: nitrous oxide reductase accessory protein NosL [Myxococcota bacterium]